MKAENKGIFPHRQHQIHGRNETQRRQCGINKNTAGIRNTGKRRQNPERKETGPQNLIRQENQVPYPRDTRKLHDVTSIRNIPRAVKWQSRNGFHLYMRHTGSTGTARGMQAPAGRTRTSRSVLRTGNRLHIPFPGNRTQHPPVFDFRYPDAQHRRFHRKYRTVIGN